MRKLNNKGFAIASILYSIMVLFLLLLLSILGILGNRKAILDKNKKDILEELNKEVLYNRINFEHKNITIINRGNIDDIRFALLDGVTALDSNGNTIGTDKINYNLDLTNIENKSYYVTYTVNQDNKTITSTRQITFVPDSADYTNNFDYTGDSQTFTTKYDGSYKIELWGAQGGDYTTFKGGKGAYTSGNIRFVNNMHMYVYVGQKGSEAITGESVSTPISYNGGGIAWSWSGLYSSSGGGATDIRLINGNWDLFESLKSRIMVAGAGGGGLEWISNGIRDGGNAGSLNGSNANSISINTCGAMLSSTSAATGGTQISPGMGNNNDLVTMGGFGFGGNSYGSSGSGGSGYYGGGAGRDFGCTPSAGAGGSSFISGYDGCDAIAENSTEDSIIHTGQSVHYSGYKFNNAVMYAGNEEIPTHDGTSTMIGNSGNGYAKISLIYYYDDSQYNINIEHNDITIVNRGNINDIKIALLDGITIKNDSNQIINNNRLKYNLDLNNIQNKTYNVTYNIGSTDFTRQITFVPDSTDYTNNFDYTGDSQTFTTKYDGSYKIELWGAQGGGYNFTGGNGAYTSGNIDLKSMMNLYLYVGSEGQYVNGFQKTVSSYNGGSSAVGQEMTTRYFGAGGGATDIRLSDGVWNSFNSLKSRIMVASAGGGSYVDIDISALDNGGYGGTITGGDGTLTITGWGSQGYGASQISGGYSICDAATCDELLYNLPDAQQGILNNGQFGYANENGIYSSTGGGGGYYGGGMAVHVQSSGGGSSFISGYDGCDAIAENSTEDNIIHTGQSVHYSGYKFNNAVMYAGNEEIPTHDGTSTMIGNSGNGYAKISLIYYY